MGDSVMTSFHIPRPHALVSHAGRHLLEATFIPLALFYAVMWTVGVWGALFVALAWSYGAVVRRLLARERIPGVLALACMLMTARTALAFASGSVFLYFLQPTLGTLAVASAFMVSVPAGRPLAQRLAADFCPLPDDFMSRPYVGRFFGRISLLWAFVYFMNAAISIWLLVSQPIGTYLIVKSALSMGLTGGAIALSTVWFRRSMARNGVTVSLAPREDRMAIPAPTPA